jgi:hypothetical protein
MRLVMSTPTACAVALAGAAPEQPGRGWTGVMGQVSEGGVKVVPVRRWSGPVPRRTCTTDCRGVTVAK